MNEVTLFIFSLSILILLAGNVIQFIRSSELRNALKKSNDVNKLKDIDINNINKSKDDILGIEPGTMGIIHNYSLQYGSDSTGDKVSFKVTFEVEVIEVSLGKIKVFATNFTSIDSVGRDPKNISGIIDFMKNKWVDRSIFEPIVGDSQRRNDKLNKILGDD